MAARVRVLQYPEMSTKSFSDQQRTGFPDAMGEMSELK